MLDIFNQKPDDNVSCPLLQYLMSQIVFMLSYLEKKFGVQAINGRPNELQSLKDQIKELEAKLADGKEDEDSDASGRSLGSHEDTDEDEDEDYMDDLPEQPKNS